MQRQSLLTLGLCGLLAFASGCGDDDENGVVSDAGGDAAMDSAAGDSGQDARLDGSADAALDAMSDATMDATADAATLGDFTLNLTSFDPHEGQKIVVTVIDQDGNTAVGAGTVQSASATESISIAGVIDANAQYTVNFYADFNENGSCDSPPTDHVWSITAQSPVDNTLVVDFEHDTNFTDVCDSIVAEF